MITTTLQQQITKQLDDIRATGLFKAERVITHRYHYTEFQQGFDAMLSGNSGKVVLTWSEG